MHGQNLKIENEDCEEGSSSMKKKSNVETIAFAGINIGWHTERKRQRPRNEEKSE